MQPTVIQALCIRSVPREHSLAVWPLGAGDGFSSCQASNCAGLCEEILLLILHRRDTDAGISLNPKYLLEGITGKDRP